MALGEPQGPLTCTGSYGRYNVVSGLRSLSTALGKAYAGAIDEVLAGMHEVPKSGGGDRGD
jgi:hypothetical protein